MNTSRSGHAHPQAAHSVAATATTTATDPMATPAGGPDSGPAPTAQCTDPTRSLARVSAVDRDHYLIRNAEGELPATLAGRLAYHCTSPGDFPCVGDWVEVCYRDAGSHASILAVRPRQSFLRRKSPGKTVEFQMIAANIDTAFIVQSCHFDFNVARLERYLVMVREGHIEPVILLTKSDRVSPLELEHDIDQIREAGIDVPVIALSLVAGSGLDSVRALIQRGKTYCLLGSSGVGKTTLINHLAGEAGLRTGAVSHSGEGCHTTTRRQLIVLAQGGLMMDMPGMRELGLLAVGQQIDAGFADIQAWSAQCRFADCRHHSEPGCAIRRAIEHGELDAGRWNAYLKLKTESDFHEMSYLEKRNKDRAFGKLVQAGKHARGRHHKA